MPDNPYACPMCDGSGEAECYACGQETDCGHCGATGLDPEKIDVFAWEKAEHAFSGRNRISSAWIESGVWLGRQGIGSTGERLAYRDFALPGHAGPEPPRFNDPHQLQLFPQ